MTPTTGARVAALAGIALLLLAGCGGEGAEPEPGGTTTNQARVTSSSPIPSSHTSTHLSTSLPASLPSQSTAVQQAPAIAAAEPTFVECVFGGGAWTDTAIMSDGSFRTHPACAALRTEQLAKYPYVCPRTDHHVADLAECGIPAETPDEEPVQAPDEAAGNAPTGEPAPTAADEVPPGVPLEP